MKRYFVLAVVALGLVFTACDEEENISYSRQSRYKESQAELYEVL